MVFLIRIILSSSFLSFGDLSITNHLLAVRILYLALGIFQVKVLWQPVIEQKWVSVKHSLSRFTQLCQLLVATPNWLFQNDDASRQQDALNDGKDFVDIVVINITESPIAKNCVVLFATDQLL